jgi:hypothetical protein
VILTRKKQEEGRYEEEINEEGDQREDKEWSSMVRRPNHTSAPKVQPHTGSYHQEYEDDGGEGEQEYEEMDELQEGFDLIQQFIIQQQQQPALDLSYPPQPRSSQPRYTSQIRTLQALRTHVPSTPVLWPWIMRC